ncbi:hypothetical protein FJ366_03375 [Candidatus Dependentiae bacterium]|nr:hypothetical protein [Candidatus Dependentiae bacterium]
MQDLGRQLVLGIFLVTVAMNVHGMFSSRGVALAAIGIAGGILSARRSALIDPVVTITLHTFAQTLSAQASFLYEKPAYVFSNNSADDFVVPKSEKDPEYINCLDEPDSVLVMFCDHPDLVKTINFMKRAQSSGQKKIIVISGELDDEWFKSPREISERVRSAAMEYNWHICVVNSKSATIFSRGVGCEETIYCENAFHEDQLFCTCFLPKMTHAASQSIFTKLIDQGVEFDWDFAVLQP